MKNLKIKNRILIYFSMILLVSFCLINTNAYSQSTLFSWNTPSKTKLSTTFNTTTAQQFSPVMPILQNVAPPIRQEIVEALPVELVSIEEEPPGREILASLGTGSCVKSINSATGELTGDMLIDFDIFPYSSSVLTHVVSEAQRYRELSYVHTPPCRLFALPTISVNDDVNALPIRPYCGKRGEAIYQFSVNRNGIYKVVENVWARNCRQDSFSVEIMDIGRRERVPFPAWQWDSSGGHIVRVRRADDNFGAPYNVWRWKNVWHKTASQWAPICVWYLEANRKYQVIFRTKEQGARLSYLQIVSVFPLDQVIDEEDGLKNLENYFMKNMDLPTVDELKGIEAADEECPCDEEESTSEYILFGTTN